MSFDNDNYLMFAVDSCSKDVVSSNPYWSMSDSQRAEWKSYSRARMQQQQEEENEEEHENSNSDADDEGDDHPRCLLLHHPRVSMVFGLLLVVPSLPLIYIYYSLLRALCRVQERTRKSLKFCGESEHTLLHE